MKSHFSLILLSTLQCNADCEYCFENKTDDRLTLDRLGEMIRKVLDYMVEKSLRSLTIYWQGGEAMLLPPSWYEQANDLIQFALESGDCRHVRQQRGHFTGLPQPAPQIAGARAGKL